MNQPSRAVPAGVRGATAALLTLVLCSAAAVLPAADAWTDAIGNRDVAAVERMAAHVADVNRATENGQTALMLAAAGRNPPLLRRLLKRGAAVNATNNRGGTALMYSATYGDLEGAALLLEHGATVNARATNGWTALTLAAALGFEAIVNELLAHGADPNIADVYGWTPLMRAADANRPSSVRALLASRRTAIDARDENGQTALHHAALQGYDDVVRLLLGHGANVRVTDEAGHTPDALARAKGHRAVAEMLRTAGGPRARSKAAGTRHQ